jgi:HrpA-like RNA helicase
LQKEHLLPSNAPKYKVFLLFSALPNSEQMKVFDKLDKGIRKIILSTNIAETSITINNIKYIVDSGYCKLRIYNSKSGLDFLKVTKISKNSAIQRSGRAGRESKGKCFRLYDEEEFEKMEDFNPPEILRVNLRNVILDLLAIGIEDLFNFDFLDKPSKESYIKAFEELCIFKAVNKTGFNLTEMGKKMSVLPVEPMFGFILIVNINKNKYNF